jgi:hypothetical protein
MITVKPLTGVIERMADNHTSEPPDDPGSDQDLTIEIFSEKELRDYHSEKERSARLDKPPEEKYEWKKDLQRDSAEELKRILLGIREVLAPVESAALVQEEIHRISEETKAIFRSALEYYDLMGLPYVSLLRAVCQTHSACLPCEKSSFFGVEQKMRKGIVVNESGERKTYDTILMYAIYLEGADVEKVELTIPLVWDGTPNLRAGFIGEVYRANGWYARPVKEKDRKRLEYSVSGFQWENYGGVPVFVTDASGIEVRLRERFENRRRLEVRGLFEFFNKLDASGRIDSRGFSNKDRIKSEIFAFSLGAVITEFLWKYPGQSEKYIFQPDNNALIRGLRKAEEIKKRRD